MPHIHIEPGQHDTTVSMYVVLKSNQPKFLLHMHRRFNKLIQLGGHIELDETPWQSVAHEIREEAGYLLDELAVLQPSPTKIQVEHSVVHPLPFLVNTFKAGDVHYHDDLCYVFTATELPKNKFADGESADLRWLTIDEIQSADQDIPQDVRDICTAIYEQALGKYYEIPASSFSVEKPKESGL